MIRSVAVGSFAIPVDDCSLVSVDVVELFISVGVSGLLAMGLVGLFGSTGLEVGSLGLVGISGCSVDSFGSVGVSIEVGIKGR